MRNHELPAPATLATGSSESVGSTSNSPSGTSSARRRRPPQKVHHLRGLAFLLTANMCKTAEYATLEYGGRRLPRSYLKYYGRLWFQTVFWSARCVLKGDALV